jgi:predicted phosphodiesterase
MEVVVLADTHLRGGLEGLPQPVLDAIAGADGIVHAGDIVSLVALQELRALGE